MRTPDRLSYLQQTALKRARAQLLVVFFLPVLFFLCFSFLVQYNLIFTFVFFLRNICHNMAVYYSRSSNLLSTCIC